jgi:hypothetical protein
MFGDYKNVENFKEQCGYTIDDVWYPRVTKIVSIKSKPALYYYYGEAKSFKAAQEVTEQSAKEGTAIHEAVEGFLLGKPVVVAPEIAPAYNAFLDFYGRQHIQATPEFVERRIVNYDHRYAGTIDAIALVGGKLGVLDIKTSQAVYRDYCLQTSAYMDALKGELKELATRWILRIDQAQRCLRCSAKRRTKGGREKVKIDWRNPLQKNCEHVWGEMEGDIELVEFPYWQKDFEGFLGAKKLWEWENEEWLKKVGYLN